MIEYLNYIDTALFSWLNSFHNSFFDEFMWLISGKLTWLPMYIFILFILYKRDWKQAMIISIIIALCITIADQVSSTLIKDTVERLRPSHNEDLSSTIHIVKDYRGGMFGFVSSHAANTIAFATFFSLLFQNRYFTITSTIWAILIMYSRIYLGVHYPGDILGGTVVGIFSGWICYKLYIVITTYRNKYKYKINTFTEIDKKYSTYAITLNTVAILLITVILFINN